jgi:phosphoglycerate dehydrogenase-like enzyme
VVIATRLDRDIPQKDQVIPHYPTFIPQKDQVIPQKTLMNRKINVLVTVPFPEKLQDTMNAVSSRLSVSMHKARSANDIPSDVWEQTHVLYSGGILPSPEQAPNLKWVQFHFAGVDRVVNEPILQRKDLLITTLSGTHVPQMGEYVLMMMLSLGHKLPGLLGLKKKSDWPNDRYDRFAPQELRGSTVGLVGYGSIGREVARLLQPFDVTVLATKWNAMQVQDPGYVPSGLGDPEGNYPRRIYPFQALKSMLAECDFVVVAVPLTEKTQGMIGAEEFAAMKETAYLVDVSRGGVIDHIALIRALKDKKIGGVALDVFPEEPLPQDSPLWKFSNVIITPHIAGNSPQYNQRAAALFIDNLNRYLSGEPLYNQFDVERGY